MPRYKKKQKNKKNPKTLLNGHGRHHRQWWRFHMSEKKILEMDKTAYTQNPCVLSYHYVSNYHLLMVIPKNDRKDNKQTL